MAEPSDARRLPAGAGKAVVVAALGYFVDLYDLILFSIVRVRSLRSLAVPEAQLLARGVELINLQMLGMLLGGVLWGVLGDRRGRLSVLFGSIALYSLANIANGFVHSVESYAALRFLAGVGLAGELGAGITLVSEVLDKKSRGFATTAVAGIGICGALLAVLVAKNFDWRVAYGIGGAMGLALLALRVGVLESGLFERTRAGSASRGNFFALFTKPRRALRYLAVVLSGVPIWYAIGVLVTFSPELGVAMGLRPAPDSANAVLAAYSGLAIGDFASGLLSQRLESRKKALLAFLLLNVAAVACYFALGRVSAAGLYAACFLVGIANGYWAVFVTVAAEQFGTNLRATATTTAPNFVRGAVVPLTLAFRALQGHVGAVRSAQCLGVCVLVLALVSLAGIDETYGRDLDFTED